MHKREKIKIDVNGNTNVNVLLDDNGEVIIVENMTAQAFQQLVDEINNSRDMLDAKLKYIKDKTKKILDDETVTADEKSDIEGCIASFVIAISNIAANTNKKIKIVAFVAPKYIKKQYLGELTRLLNNGAKAGKDIIYNMNRILDLLKN